MILKTKYFMDFNLRWFTIVKTKQRCIMNHHHCLYLETIAAERGGYKV